MNVLVAFFFLSWWRVPGMFWLIAQAWWEWKVLLITQRRRTSCGGQFTFQQPALLNADVCMLAMFYLPKKERVVMWWCVVFLVISHPLVLQACVAPKNVLSGAAEGDHDHLDCAGNIMGTREGISWRSFFFFFEDLMIRLIACNFLLRLWFY